MPSKSSRDVRKDKRNAERERVADEAKIEAKRRRVEELKTQFPQARDRCRLALQILLKAEEINFESPAMVVMLCK